jgi:hypothetical protein
LGKFEQIKETGFGRQNQLSMFTLGPTGRLVPVAFFFGAKFPQLATKKKKKAQCDLYKRIFLKNFQKNRHIPFKKKKEFARFRQ